MISIDFQGGAHGNFLEFVCNVAVGVKVDHMPFNQAGAAHSKLYKSMQVFRAGHYSFLNIPLPTKKVIAIKIALDDLLPLSQISLLRAGDYGYDSENLEINTYNKLNNVDYRWVLDNILNSFFLNQVKDSYNAVKDMSWPDVANISDFKNLPEHIRKECIEVHHLKLLELTETQPDCPRYILREFFQIGFENPSMHGFITEQKKMTYNDQTDVYKFPFSDFYHSEFLDHIEKIAHWAGFKYTNSKQVSDLHDKFLERQPYRHSKIKCDQIVEQIINKEIFTASVNLLEESYINAMLRKNGHECRY